MTAIPDSVRPFLTSPLLAVLLAACGGGSDGAAGAFAPTSVPGVTDSAVTAPADAVDKYVGTWFACFPDSSAGGSSAETLVFERTGAAAATFRSREIHFVGAGCTGTSSADDSESGAVSLTGTKLVSGENADEVAITEGNTTRKNILAVRADGRLYTGSDRSEPDYSADAEGYPERFNPTGYAKQ